MKTYEEKQQDLEDRTIEFSINIANTCVKYAEADNSSSRANFKTKIYIAKKEVAKTHYWLKVLSKLLVNHDLSPLEQGAKELNLILQKIISTMKPKELPNNVK